VIISELTMKKSQREVFLADLRRDCHQSDGRTKSDGIPVPPQCQIPWGVSPPSACRFSGPTLVRGAGWCVVRNGWEGRPQPPIAGSRRNARP